MTEARAQETMILVEEYLAVWRKDPEYLAAYSAFEEESHAPRRTAMRQRISSEPAPAR
jgi:hypothetical protein